MGEKVSQVMKSSLLRPSQRLALCTVLVLFFALGLSSLWNDSFSMDEPEHLVAGYTYLTTQNGWLNSWHPPLFKLLGALPLLFFDLPHPETCQAWVDFKKPHLIACLLLGSTDQLQPMLRAARSPLLLLATLFCGFFFFSVLQRHGPRVAFIALLMLAFSPLYLAHARYVTNDIAATCAFFGCLCALERFLRAQNRKNFTLLVLAVGIAQLTKFSLLLVYPLCFIVIVLWFALTPNIEANATKLNFSVFPRKLFQWSVRSLILSSLLFVGAQAVVLVGYNFHTRNLSAAYQEVYNTDLCTRSLPTVNPQCRRSLLPQFVDYTFSIPALRGYSWYLTGIAGQTFRAAAHQPFASFFVGEKRITKGASYFATLFILKEPLGSLLCLGIALGVGVGWFMRVRKNERMSIRTSLQKNFLLTSGILFSLVYLSVALASSVHLGLRHLLPVYPFLYWVVAVGWLSMWERRRPLRIPLLVLLIAGLTPAVTAWPGYLSYFNQLAGGTTEGYKIAADSNVDWSTDLYRLKQYVDLHNIKKLNVSYNGPIDARFYLGDRCHNLRVGLEPWADKPYAISSHHWSNLLAGAETTGSLAWVRQMYIKERIGTSMFILDRIP
jgi:4-amino-4-deoxy-L-arabinose transferase-like glycosyltransferase